MYRCPKCRSEILPDALFCATCGFNHTNARMQAVNPPQVARNVPPTNPHSMIGVAQPHIPDGPMPPHPQTRMPYPTAQVPPPAAPPAAPPQVNRMPPPVQTTPIYGDYGSPSMPANNNDAIRPVRTNTPPKSDMGNAAGSPPQQAATNQQPANGLSLTHRYLAEQQMNYHASTASSESPRTSFVTPLLPPQPQDAVWATPAPQPQQPSQVPQAPHMVAPAMYPPTQQAKREALGEDLDSEVLAANNKASERWHQSWRDRQHAEAGPAVGITRGQAVVAEPLMAMQHSIARMRAIIMPSDKDNQASRGRNFGFWVTILLLICITTSLSGYVIWTYIPAASLSTQLTASNPALPILSVKGTTTVTTGQTISMHGEHFTSNDAITFVLDNTPLHDTSGQVLSTKSNAKGAFDAAIPIPATLLTGNYTLQAQDKQTGTHAFLTIQVRPATSSLSNDTPLNLTANELPIATTGLTFQTIMGGTDPTTQQITLGNTGTDPIQWSATTLADNNLSWLILDGNTTSGTLAPTSTDHLSIGITSMGLKSAKKTYTGRVILTVGQTQAIIPVSLLVQNPSIEVVINPNPVIAHFLPGGTCQPVSLTLINLSNQVIIWNANPFDVDTSHIHLNNQTSAQGTLDPSGSANDTKVLQITCIGAQVGEKLYHISVYYNGTPVNVPVSIRNS